VCCAIVQDQLELPLRRDRSGVRQLLPNRVGKRHLDLGHGSEPTDRIDHRRPPADPQQAAQFSHPMEQPFVAVYPLFDRSVSGPWEIGDRSSGR
jgi:hypothetical protein